MPETLICSLCIAPAIARAELLTNGMLLELYVCSFHLHRCDHAKRMALIKNWIAEETRAKATTGLTITSTAEEETADGAQ